MSNALKFFDCSFQSSRTYSRTLHPDLKASSATYCIVNTSETINLQFIERLRRDCLAVAFSFDTTAAVARRVHYKSINGLHYFMETLVSEQMILLRIIMKGC